MKKTKLSELIKDYKFNSVFLKNLRMLVALITLPLLIMSIAIYSYYDSFTKNELSYKYAQPLTNVRNYTDDLLRDSQNITITLSADEYVQIFTATPKDALSSDTFYKMNINIRTLISNLMTLSDAIDSVYVYSGLNQYVLSNTVSAPINEFSDIDVIHKLNNYINLSDSFIEVRKIKYPEEKNYLTIYNKITTFQSADGMIILNINLDTINDHISSLGIKDNLYIFTNNKLLYTNSENDLLKSLSEIPILDNIQKNKTEYAEFQKYENTIFTVLKSEYNDWNFLIEFTHTSDVLKLFLFLIVILGIIISLSLAFFITKKLYRPIEGIISVFDNPEKWIENHEVNPSDIDEFKFITNNILKHYDNQKKMETELAKRLTGLKNAQSIALITQINPHFLFNTISTIKLLSMKLTGGENDVSLMISLLSDILMYSMNTKERIVPLKDEITITKKYLQILELRYKGRFNVIWDIDEKITESYIIKLALQPIIENAVEYGLKNMKTNGIIHIKGYLQDDIIKLEVTDNGIGMEPEKLNKLNENMTHDYIKENTHLGLENVNQRIRLVFGEEYGLTLSTAPTGGLCVTFRFPNQ